MPVTNRPLISLARSLAADGPIDKKAVDKLIDKAFEDGKIDGDERLELEEIDNEYRDQIYSAGASERIWAAYQGGFSNANLAKKAFGFDRLNGEISADDAKSLVAELYADQRIDQDEVATLRTVALGGLNVTNAARNELLKSTPGIVRPYERADLAFRPEPPYEMNFTVGTRSGPFVRMNELVDDGWTKRTVERPDETKASFEREFDTGGHLKVLRIDLDNDGKTEEIHRYEYDADRVSKIVVAKGDKIDAPERSEILFEYDADGKIKAEKSVDFEAGKKVGERSAEHSYDVNSGTHSVRTKHNGRVLYVENRDSQMTPKGPVSTDEQLFDATGRRVSRAREAGAVATDLISTALFESETISDRVNDRPMSAEAVVEKDELGRIKTATDGESSAAYTYNEAGQIASYERKDRGRRIAATLTYDDQGRLKTEDVVRIERGPDGQDKRIADHKIENQYAADGSRKSSKIVDGKIQRECERNSAGFLTVDRLFADNKENYRREYKLSAAGQVNSYAETTIHSDGEETALWVNTFKDGNLYQSEGTHSSGLHGQQKELHERVLETFDKNGNVVARRSEHKRTSPALSKLHTRFDTGDLSDNSRTFARIVKDESFKYNNAGEFVDGTSTVKEEYYLMP